METNVKERLISFIKYMGLSQAKFEKRIGVSNGFVNNMRKSIGVEKLENILREFPDLNREWLLYGEGEMLRENSPKMSASASLPEAGNSGSETLLMRIIESKDAKIEELSRRIGELEAENRLLKEKHFRDTVAPGADSAVAG